MWMYNRTLRRLGEGNAFFTTAWIVAIIGCEVVLPAVYIIGCRWPWPNQSSPKSITRVLLITDPQLTDQYSYRQPNGIRLRLTELYSDLYMRKNYALLMAFRRPDAVIVLGDLFDGGREWGVGDPRFEHDLRRFQRIFRRNLIMSTPAHADSKSEMGFYVAAGNHDVGFGSTVVRDAYERYVKVWGKPNYSFTLGGHAIVVLDTVSLSAGKNDYRFDGRPYDTASSNAATEFLDEFSKSQSSADKSLLSNILISHIPLFRPPTASCGPKRYNPELRQGAGYQYQNLVTEQLSNSILSIVKPVLVFSGDDHDYCFAQHKIGDQIAVEHTLPTFSWMQGNSHPGYMLLTLAAWEEPMQNEGAVQLCRLMPQIPVFVVYVTLFSLMLLTMLVRAWRSRSGGSGRLPGSYGRGMMTKFNVLRQLLRTSVVSLAVYMSSVLFWNAV
ncbi:Metallo-dependent phosphatase-like protein [Cladochytrium replicatum]|nr:Metallo-dependent phosphatase-like protein [Cladochytrium replicatum]